MTKRYAVIDTNVVVSAMLIPSSIPGTVLKYVFAGVLVPLINDEIMGEYIEVLNRDKFDFDKNDIESIISNIKSNALVLDKTVSNEKFVDQKDIVFYEIALTGVKEKDSYLVTGNTKHFPDKPFVVTPKEMVDIIEKSDS